MTDDVGKTVVLLNDYANILEETIKKRVYTVDAGEQSLYRRDDIEWATNANVQSQIGTHAVDQCIGNANT